MVGKDRVDGDYVFRKRDYARLDGKFVVVGAPAVPVPLIVVRLR